jgi:hypothetical protein
LMLSLIPISTARLACTSSRSNLDGWALISMPRFAAAATRLPDPGLMAHGQAGASGG